MKVNAPEKIYRTTFYLDDDKGDTKWKKTPVAGAENIEYIRTDAFIEKACSYIRLYSSLLDTENNDCMPEWLDKFRNAMKK